MKPLALYRALRAMARLATASALAGSLPALAAGCSIATSGVAFGSYDTLQAMASDSAGDLTVSCSVPTAYSVALGTGAGDYGGRRLTGGRGGGLVYNLFTDASRSTVWGDGSAASVVVSGVAPAGGVAARHTVHGRIPARQNVFVGPYSDSVGILVSY